MPSLLFLMRLQHVPLPARITDPAELRHVSVLTATGLIEATIETLTTKARYNISLRQATVLCITDEGLKELEAMKDLPQFAGTSMGLTGRLHLIN